jgi:TRAP-type C4-dicarboxylate transport system permease small subunit
MKKLGAILNKVTNIIAKVSLAGVAVLMLLNVADVILTKLFARSIQGAYEISENVLMCAVFAAFAYGQTQKTHVHMTLIIGKLPGGLRFIPYALCGILSSIMSAVFIYAAFLRADRMLTTGTVTGILHIPVYPFYCVSAVCLILFAVTVIYDTVLSVLAIFREDYAELVSKNW